MRTWDTVCGCCTLWVWTCPEEDLVLCDCRIVARLESHCEVSIEVEPGGMRISVYPSLRVWLCTLKTEGINYAFLEVDEG